MSEKNQNKEIEIPEEGNLGILAYGDIGLKAWRKKRKELEGKKNTNKKIEKKKDE